MTALGKMLVFLVLLLSLVFNGLVVNAYVTRTNWKDVADEHKATAGEAAAAVRAMEDLLKTERAATAEALNRAREEKYKYEDLCAKQKAESDGLQTAIETSMSDSRKDSATQIAAQALVDNLQKQVDNLTSDLSKLRSDNDGLVETSEVAKIARTKAEIEAAAQQARADQLEDQLRRANDRLAQMKAGGGSSGSGGRSRPPRSRSAGPSGPMRTGTSRSPRAWTPACGRTPRSRSTASCPSRNTLADWSSSRSTRRTASAGSSRPGEPPPGRKPCPRPATK